MDLEALERRIRRLEDLEEIKQLKARYAAYCDAGYDADALADLFTTDAVWDGGMLGRNEGREAIRQFFRGSSQRISFAVHNILSPIIEIAGDTATGTWYLLQTCTYIKGNQAVWGRRRITTGTCGRMACGSFNTCVSSRTSGHRSRKVGRACDSCSGAMPRSRPTTLRGRSTPPRVEREGGMLLIGRLLVGLLLLVLGRRLYWLFVAGIGFLYGLELAPRLLPEQSETVIVIVALVLALVGALVAVVATKVVLGMIGFVAGGGIAVLLLGNLGIDRVVALAVYLIAGVIGAVLLLVLFDWTLIVLSSLAGASLIVMSLERLLQMPPIGGTVLVLVLAAVGALIQAGLWRRTRPSP